MLSQKLKILYVITSLRTGGAERLVVDLAKKLTEQGHIVEILILDGSVTPFMQELKDLGIKIHRGHVGYFQIYNPLNILKIKNLANKNKYQIIHSHNSSAQLFLALAGVTVKTKLVTTEHNTTNRRRRFSFLKTFEKFIYNHYDAIVSVSNQVKKNLIDHLGYKATHEETDRKFPVIYNGVDLSKFIKSTHKNFSEQSSTGSHFCSLGRTQNVILMIAGFRKQKDHATAIKAMQHLNDNFVLWLAGDGETKRECEILAKNLGIEHKINFLGEIEDVNSLISQAKIVILSTHYEGLPLVAIEAMAAGKPFIGSDVEGIKEIAGNAGILFQEGNNLELARRIERLIVSPQDYETVALNCRTKAVDFDINNTAEMHIRLYRRLLASEPTKIE